MDSILTAPSGQEIAAKHHQRVDVDPFLEGNEELVLTGLANVPSESLDGRKHHNPWIDDEKKDWRWDSDKRKFIDRDSTYRTVYDGVSIKMFGNCDKSHHGEAVNAVAEYLIATTAATLPPPGVAKSPRRSAAEKKAAAREKAVAKARNAEPPRARDYHSELRRHVEGSDPKNGWTQGQDIPGPRILSELKLLAEKKGLLKHGVIAVRDALNVIAGVGAVYLKADIAINGTAKSVSRIGVPMYAPDAKISGLNLCSPHHLRSVKPDSSDSEKQWVKGRNEYGCKSGLFMPHEVEQGVANRPVFPRPNDKVLLVSGWKDQALAMHLVEKGLLEFDVVIGLSASSIAGHEHWFVDCDVTFAPDLDNEGVGTAKAIGNSLDGIAKSFSIAWTGDRITAKHGRDLRDALAAGGIERVVKAFAAREAYQEKELPRPAADSEPATSADKSGPIVTDAPWLRNTVSVDNEGGGTRTHIKNLQVLVEEVTNRFPDKLFSVGNQLFADQGTEHPWLLKNPTTLFAFMKRAGNVDWNSRHAGAVTQGEFFEELKTRVPRFESIEIRPHFPPIARIKYLCNTSIQPGNGDRLAELLGRFEPATMLDMELLKAFTVTLLWGGPAGRRPLFIFAADRPGSGKSTAVELLTSIVGEVLSVGRTTDGEAIRRRILSEGAIGKRVIFRDNAKGKVDSEDYESLITSSTISGHRMFSGEGCKPNYFTWAISANTPSVGDDISQRAVFVRIGMAKYSGTWLREAKTLIDSHRDEIIADIKGFFETPRSELGLANRWGDWSHDVLSRLNSPEEVFRLIASRQRESNEDLEVAQDIMAELDRLMATLGYRNDQAAFIESEALSEILSPVIGSGRFSARGISRFLNLKIKGGLIERLVQYKTKSHRGFVWRGSTAFENTAPAMDFEVRK